MMKLILDTDIGTDVDDAVCLAYLLAQPECDLLGITTVTGEAEQRAALASVLCKSAGREIPIFPGEGTTLNGAPWQNTAPQAAALPRWPHENRFPRGEAVEFMRRTIRSNPGELVIVAVGPLSNVGRLCLADPEIPRLLRGMYIMGGIHGEPPPGLLAPGQVEWNIAGDPQAAEVVYRSPARVHRSLGLNVTQQVVLEADAVRRRFTSPRLRPVLDFAEIWFRDFYPSITFHDPLTAAAVFDENLCTFRRGTITVAPGEGPARTRWQSGGPDAPHEAAMSVDVEGYFRHFFEIMDAGD
jgi:inosine-uridine nucleoside N-ribohydrolase